MQLIVHGIVGTAVLVRCFVDRRNIEGQIMEKLGNGFTRAPFASVVVYSLCMVVFSLGSNRRINHVNVGYHKSCIFSRSCS